MIETFPLNPPTELSARHSAHADGSSLQTPARGELIDGAPAFPSQESASSATTNREAIDTTGPLNSGGLGKPQSAVKTHQLMAGARIRAIVLKARELRSQNLSWNEVARSVSVSISTVFAWCERVKGIADSALTAADCAPQNHKAGRPRKYVLSDAEAAAIKSLNFTSNRTSDDGSVQEAVRKARARGQLSPEVLAMVNDREARGLPLLPEALHQEASIAPAYFRQLRNPTDADLDFISAPGSMMWVEDDLTLGERRFVRAGDILEADDATINFPVCVPWEMGGCKVSERWGVKVGRFQWLVAIDVASRFIPGFSYTARPRSSYRAEDIVSLLCALFRAHGIWRRCRFERGTFESDLVTNALANLGVLHLPVWSPHQKPFIENLFNQLWTKLSDLPGQVGRFQGEMESGSELLTKCQSGSTDPRQHFPMLGDALKAMQQAINERNAQPIHSKLYGSWIPRDRWEIQRGDDARNFLPLDLNSLWMFAPCVKAWTVQGSQVGGAVRLIDSFSIPFEFGADFLLEYDGCSVRAYFDPAAHDCSATIVLAQNVRDRQAGEVLGVAPQISKVAAYARKALGYSIDIEDEDRAGLKHRAQAAAALRREVRAITSSGKASVATSEVRDGQGNGLSVSVGTAVPGGPLPSASSALSAVKTPSPETTARARATRSRLAAIANQLRDQTL